jgi:soluble lytic murein transglycosylase-like protein
MPLTDVFRAEMSSAQSFGQGSVPMSARPEHHSNDGGTLFIQSRRRSRLHTALLALTAAVQVLTAAIAHDGGLDQNRSSPCSTARPFAEFTAEASRRFGLPERTIRTVMGVESDCNPRALSPKGARGLMQIMPATWQELRRRYALGNDPYDARDNILAGAAYLREMRDRFGTPGFLAAYNAGPERYAAYLATGRGLPDETSLYLAKVGAVASGNVPERTLKRGARVPAVANAPLFVAHPPSSPAAEPASIDPQDDRSPATERSLWNLHGAGLFVPSSTPAARQ